MDWLMGMDGFMDWLMDWLMGMDGLIDGDGWIKINGLIDGWMYWLIDECIDWLMMDGLIDGWIDWWMV